MSRNPTEKFARMQVRAQRRPKFASIVAARNAVWHDAIAKIGVQVVQHDFAVCGLMPFWFLPKAL